MTQEGGRILSRILGQRAFAYPKPLSLVRSLVRAATRGDDIVLDSFAGSGTTGHAVLDLNREDAGRRRFLLVEREPDIAREITAERLRRVVQGYSYLGNRGNAATVEGLGGGFRFCELGPSLLDQDGAIREEVTFAELARHVFFTETGVPLARRPDRTSPLVGVHNGTAVYLLYNEMLGGRRRDGGNVLTSALLAELPPHDGPKVIYAESCRLGESRLRRENIVFKQTPYDVRVG